MAKYRMNLTLPKRIEARLDAYCIEVAKKRGAVVHGLKTSIARKATEEWLDRNEENYDVDTLLGEGGKYH